jgi:hypothetical protein
MYYFIIFLVIKTFSFYFKNFFKKYSIKSFLMNFYFFQGEIVFCYHFNLIILFLIVSF